MKLTIGLPVYNAGPFLIDALRSIFAQTYQDWELIIVDDGSMDGSLEIARQVRDPRVAVYSDGRNCGLSTRLNQIAELAKGQYLARMDADDIMHPERLARQVEFLDANPEIDVVDSAVYSIDHHNVPRGIRGLEAPSTSRATALKQCLLQHPAVLGRTVWFRRNPYDPVYWRGEDHEIWFRTQPYSKFSRILEPLLFYREGSMSLKSYKATAHTDRQLFYRFGPEVLGTWQTLAQIVRNWTKVCVFGAFARFGAQKTLMRLRNRSMRPHQVSAASEIIRQVLRTPVPGLEDDFVGQAPDEDRGSPDELPERPCRSGSDGPPQPGSGTPSGPAMVLYMAVPISLQFLAGVPRLLRTRGVRMHVASSPGDLLDEFCRSEGCPGHGVPTSRSISPLRDIVSVFRLWRLLRRIRPHIVEAHMSKAGLLGMAAAWLARVPLRIYVNHGVAFSSTTGWRKLLLKATEWISSRLATRVHCVSDSVRDLLVAGGCCPAEKIQVLGNGSCGTDAVGRFNPDRFDPEARRTTRAACGIPQNARVLGYVGRIAKLKGIEDLAVAWKSLRERYHDLHLLLVGDHEPRNPISSETAALLQDDPRVHWIGFVEDTAPFYSIMDIQILPSHHEGLPVTLLEGGAMRLPIVATRIPGNVDAILDGTTGQLVSPHEPTALARAVATYLDHAELARRHGDAARQRVLRSFQREIVWDAMLAEYTHLLRRNALPPLVQETPVTAPPIAEGRRAA